jgi:hypothetical protein
MRNPGKEAYIVPEVSAGVDVKILPGPISTSKTCVSSKPTGSRDRHDGLLNK